MGYELIVSEKPSQAKKIAESLSDGKPTVKKEDGVSYYIITHKGKDIVVAAAVGHVYSLAEKEKSFKYPSYDIEWQPAFKVDKNSAHTKKYIKIIQKLAKGADEVTVATDFDVEGEVIGLNLVRYACKKKDGNRMKFSTLTKDDLIEAYEKKRKTLEWGQANAGETRHFLDWMYGINLSRALSTSIRKAGLFKTLSSGRVQGPSLKLVVDKEKEIRKFVPVPFWQITYKGEVSGKNTEEKGVLNALYEEEKIFDKNKAEEIYKKVNGKDGEISKKETREVKNQPPTPFDLTTLQTESYRSLKIPPKETLAIAQELYTNGWVSYPRTSSQQIPPEVGYKKILEALKRHNTYKPLAEQILGLKDIKPNNGKKTDPAHPAIYPTGIIPDISKLHGREIKVYDLIVRRFLATFADAAVRETNKLTINVEGESFIAKGTRTTYPGWFTYYGPHVKLEEEELPKVGEGEQVKHKKVTKEEKETQPPKRYTPASLIKELEKRNLGTKATRAAIIDTLFQRGYVAEKTLEPTEIGIKTSDVMEKFVPDIVKEDLTRHFEEEMEKIREHQSSEQKVLEKAKDVLTKTLESIRKKEKEVGGELKESLFESQEKENTIGECPVCKKGTLMIRYSPKTKQHFIGCNAYPDCKTIFSLPGNGKNVTHTDKFCEECGYPLIKVGKGRNERIVCFNMKCPKKIEEDKQALPPEAKKALEKPCPECGGELLIRRSVYGEFIGCSNFPKCRHTQRLDGNSNTGKKSFKKTTKKSTKKTTTKKSTKKTTSKKK